MEEDEGRCYHLRYSQTCQMYGAKFLSCQLLAHLIDENMFARLLFTAHSILQVAHLGPVRLLMLFPPPNLECKNLFRLGGVVHPESTLPSTLPTCHAADSSMPSLPWTRLLWLSTARLLEPLRDIRTRLLIAGGCVDGRVGVKQV